MLTGSISNEDIFINGFCPSPFRSDKSSTTRNDSSRGDCLYFKESLPIKERCDLEIIPETVVAEIKLNRKKVFIVLSYCHPNLGNDVFIEYLSSLENIYESIHKEIPLVSIFVEISTQGLPYFGKAILKITRGIYLTTFYYRIILSNLLVNPLMRVRMDPNLVLT